MTGDDFARLAYIGLLAFAAIGWLVAQGREGIGIMLQRAMVWCFIFLGVIGGIGLWQDIRTDLVPRQMVLEDGARIEVPRAPDGHYYLRADVNGKAIDFVVDTGATDIVLTSDDAERSGIDTARLSFSGLAGTANGMVRTAPVTLDSVTLGGVTDTGIRAVVNAGEMDQSLLGMRYLQRFDRIEISGGTLVLER